MGIILTNNERDNLWKKISGNKGFIDFSNFKSFYDNYCKNENNEDNNNRIITGENLTYIEEKNWILNEEEKERCKRFEEFDKKINEKIDKNLSKLSKVKSLVFDNCSNHFIQLILKKYFK